MAVKLSIFMPARPFFWWDATGNKLKKKVTDGTTITTTEYMDGFQYTNNVLDFFPHAEGYIKTIPSSIGGGGGDAPEASGAHHRGTRHERDARASGGIKRKIK